VCDPPCANGTCTAPDTCECGTTGFSGPTCETPVCDPPCANGTCTAPDTCECGTTGFSGPTCETPVCDPPCANGTCTAPDTCDCAGSGYEGVTCDEPICTTPCANGGACTAPDTCNCAGTGYTGPDCSLPACDPPCDNGGVCISTNVCSCAGTGYDLPTCSTSTCTGQLDGTACDTLNGCDAADTCEGGRCVTSPEPGVWVPGRALPAPRANHAAALVTGSRVVVAGGRNATGPLSSTLLYTHTTSSWQTLGALSAARDHAASAVLDDERLLVVGGRTSGITASSAVDLFDPATDLWVSSGSLSTPRYHHALVPLANGAVLAIGGFTGVTATASVERYEPVGGSWAPAASMFEPRSSAGASLLPDGRVLVVGGDLGPESGQALASAEVYDPATGTWEPLPPLPLSIKSPSLLASNGAIYLVGGSTTTPNVETLSQTWLFDALAEPEWQILASLSESREAPAVFLGDGDLFVAGGAWIDAATWRHRASAERLDTVGDRWGNTAPLASAVSGHTLTALPDGVVLRVGGYSGPSAAAATATTDVALYYAGCGASACDATPPDEVCAPPVLEPTCDPACAHGGTCVAPNLCDCAGTGFVGATCADFPKISWTRTFGTASEDSGGQSGMLTRSHDGHFIAVGGTTSTDSDGDGYLVKVDDTGALLDSRTYGGTASDGFLAITRVGTGYAACGSSRSSGGSRNRGWCVTLGSGLASTSSTAYGGTDLTNLFDVTATSDGHFVSTGNTTDSDAWLDMVVRKHDANGVEVWKKYFARSQDDTAFNVLAFSSGGYLITGFTGGWSSCQQYYAVRIDNSGTKTWDRTYGSCSSGSQGGWHQLRQVVETADGGFVGTGSTVIGGVRSLFLQKFAANGTSEWQRTFGGANNEYGAGLVATSDGGYAIVGWTNSFGAGGDDIYLIRTTSDGTLLWQRTFGGSADEQGYSILAMPDGGFMLAGTTRSWGAGGADLVIIRTDVDGNAPVPIKCTPACQNGGTCVATNQCDCAGTGYFGASCQYGESEYVNAWTKDTEPRVTGLNAQATVGTLSWHRLVGAVSYKVWRYSGANYARQLEATVTTRTYDASASYAYRIEAIGAGDVILDFVNVGISTIVASNWTTGTFTDDFTDGVLAPNYLNLKPQQISESGGYLQITQTVTDDYPAFYLPYDTQGKRYFKVTARLYQYRSNSQYTGGIFYLPAENNWKNSYFGSPWEDYRSWRGGQFRHTRYRGNPPTDDISPIIALDSVSRFGSWFDYQVTFDTETGIVTGSLGGETFPAHFPVQTQFLATGKILIYFSCYGWFTGHYLRVDDLRVESYD
ncbi:MAG: hypothetical protein IV100_09380, partial [Myxococcales bacterium]|nr:hypothetical protein [Myxococcales bacterium]